MTEVDKLIAERSTTHGDYLRNAEITQRIKAILREGARYGEMHPAMQETLDMISHKEHRIVNGDPFFREHWVDIEGYAHLILQNWERLLGYQTRSRIGSRGPEIVRTSDMLMVSAEELLSVGIRMVDGHLQRTLTPAQEDMGRDFAERRALRVADDGGPIVESDIEERDPVLPSQEERHPISATWKEYDDIMRTTIAHGSMKGKNWGTLYHMTSKLTGRHDMILEFQSEYGV